MKLKLDAKTLIIGGIAFYLLTRKRNNNSGYLPPQPTNYPPPPPRNTQQWAAWAQTIVNSATKSYAFIGLSFPTKFILCAV